MNEEDTTAGIIATFDDGSALYVDSWSGGAHPLAAAVAPLPAIVRIRHVAGDGDWRVETYVAEMLKVAEVWQVEKQRLQSELGRLRAELLNVEHSREREAYLEVVDAKEAWRTRAESLERRVASLEVENELLREAITRPGKS